MIVTEAEGRFVTQRQEPKLALIQTSLPEHASVEGGDSQGEPRGALTLSAFGMAPLQVKAGFEHNVPACASTPLVLADEFEHGIR